MKIFDSHINKNIFLNKNIINTPIELGSGKKISIPLDLSHNNLNVDLICKKQSGDSFINISFFKNKILLKTFKEIIDFTIFNNKQLSYTLSDSPDEIIIEKNKGSIGKIIINRIIISNKNEYTANVYSKICFIIPYQLYGGAEVYLENLLKNSPEYLEIDILINKDNNLKNATFPKNIKIKDYLNNIFNFLSLNNYHQIIFYNSKKIYNQLLLYKEKNKSVKIYEIYHSDFVWPDSMALVKDRSGIDTVFKTSNLVGKNININNQIICPPPLDFSRYNFYRKTGNIKNLGFIGRLSTEKNPFLAIDIANKLNIKLLIAGDGPLRKDLFSRINNNNITFLGWQNPLEFYKKIDCLILTSEIEGVPNVILEALSSGIPIISTDVGGISEILEDTVSFLFKKEDLNIDKIKKFIENSLNYNYKNVLKAKKYDKEITCKRFFDEIEKDFIKPIEIEIKNNNAIIDGILL